MDNKLTIVGLCKEAIDYIKKNGKWLPIDNLPVNNIDSMNKPCIIKDKNIMLYVFDDTFTGCSLYSKVKNINGIELNSDIDIDLYQFKLNNNLVAKEEIQCIYDDKVFFKLVIDDKEIKWKESDIK